MGGIVLCMANLSLKTRRRLARGFSRRVLGPWAERKFVGIGNRATLTTSQGSNKDLTFISKSVGTGGNSTTVRYVVSGANTPLSVSVVGQAITVNVATNGSSVATSTAAQVRDAINNSTTANVLVWAQSAPGSDATGVVSALAATNLAGAISAGAY